MSKRRFREKTKVAVRDEDTAAKGVAEKEPGPVNGSVPKLDGGAEPEPSAAVIAGEMTADITSTEDKADEVVQTLQAEVQENYDKYLRALAELENHKKRTLKERSELIRYAGEHLARDLLDVVDNLERACQQQPNGVSDEFFKGVAMILSQLKGVLEKHSIRGESVVGQSFDPEKHQAMAVIPSSIHAPGTIIEEFCKSYFFKDKLLRPAQVVVVREEETNNAAENKEE